MDKRHTDPDDLDPSQMRDTCAFHEARAIADSKLSGRVETIFYVVGWGIPLITGLLSLLCSLVYNTHVSTSDLAKIVATNSQRLLSIESDLTNVKNKQIAHDTDIVNLKTIMEFRNSTR